MSAMSELHAEVQRAVSAPAAEAIREALNEVVVRSRVAQQCPDTEAAIKALRDVSWAAIRAGEIIRTIERETRESALAALSQRSAA